MISTDKGGMAGMMLRGRTLELALLAALATLATVLAKTAVLASQDRVKGPLVTGALLTWLWLVRRVRAWLDDDLADVGR
jgi:hypothetical protein